MNYRKYANVVDERVVVSEGRMMWLGGPGNLSATYWSIVIRPQLSRTATTKVWDTCDRSISVFNRPTRKKRLVKYIRENNRRRNANT
jgi:hypothetical protein